MSENETSHRAELDTLIAGVHFSRLDSHSALDHIGRLTDLAITLADPNALQRALELAELTRQLALSDSQLSTLDYFESVVWSERSAQASKSRGSSHAWDNKAREQAILRLRRSAQRMAELAPGRQCQILTNLGNELSNAGRTVEAITQYDRALRIMPTFSMAHGNRAITLYRYAAHSWSHQSVSALLLEAQQAIRRVGTDVEQHAVKAFHRWQAFIEQRLVDVGHTAAEPGNMRWGRSKAESEYRRFVANKRLFLNPRNEIDAGPSVASDPLHLRGIVTPLDGGNELIALINQIKQEFCAARFLLHEGLGAKRGHYADRGVHLIDTLDYSEYGLATEKLRAAYRLASSLLDKIAFFLNAYLRIGIPEQEVAFRRFWFKHNEAKQGLRPEFIRRQRNDGLAGLFWLAKDLSGGGEEWRDSIDPEGNEAYDLRNTLEHRFLQLHDSMWRSHPQRGTTPPFVESRIRTDFERSSIWIMRLTRAAIIYLVAAVLREEHERRVASSDTIVPTMPLESIPDRWKR